MVTMVMVYFFLGDRHGYGGWMSTFSWTMGEGVDHDLLFSWAFSGELGWEGGISMGSGWCWLVFVGVGIVRGLLGFRKRRTMRSGGGGERICMGFLSHSISGSRMVGIG